MRRFIDVPIVCLLSVTLGLGASSCTKGSTTAGTSSGSVAVSDVEVGRSVGADKRVSDKTESFRPTDTIYASVQTSGSAPTATLKARWLYEGGQVVNESETTIAPTGDAASEFHVSKPDGFPAGKYKVEIYLNGNLAQTKEFEVK